MPRYCGDCSNAAASAAAGLSQAQLFAGSRTSAVLSKWNSPTLSVRRMEGARRQFVSQRGLFVGSRDAAVAGEPGRRGERRPAAGRRRQQRRCTKEKKLHLKDSSASTVFRWISYDAYINTRAASRGPPTVSAVGGFLNRRPRPPVTRPPTRTPRPLRTQQRESESDRRNSRTSKPPGKRSAQACAGGR